MYFRQLRLPDMGCASYLIGGDGLCAVVDPRWDATAQYIGLAQRQGLRITHIIETHTHADHVSGASRLAARTGATILIHENAAATYPHLDLHDGDMLLVGPARITTLHTPGHSMDSISLLVEDTQEVDAPRLLTGDTLFAGDVGRPDLHGVEAAALAQKLYDSLHDRLLPLNPALDVFPGHLAGSLCGKRIAPDPSTTIGRERQTSPALNIANRDAFVEAMLADLPPRPPNVSRIVQLNRSGAALSRPQVTHVAPAAALSLLRTATPVDGRDYPVFAAGSLCGALNAPISYGQFGLMLAWTLPAEMPLLLITADDDDLDEAVDALMVVGMTNPLYALDGTLDDWRAASLPVITLPLVTPHDLADRVRTGRTGMMLDVREPGELGGGVIAGSLNLPYRLLARKADLPHLAEPVTVVCNSGNRSTFAASLLASYGICVVNLRGGTTAWEEAGLPLVLALTEGATGRQEVAAIAQ